MDNLPITQDENVDLNELTLQYANRIKEFQMKPKIRIFIISSIFVKGLESFPETKKIPKVQNSELKNAFASMSSSANKNKNKKKNKNQKNKNLQINKDYFAVDEDLWNDIMLHFGGGPEISYYVCDDGTIDLTNFQINVKCGTEKKNIQTSMKTDLQTFHLQVLNAFGFDFDNNYKLCANNSQTPISVEGTVGGRIANEKLLILSVHDKEKKLEYPPIEIKKEKDDTNSNRDDKTQSNAKQSNEITKPLGLKNTGNSCYMNSVIQCFASVDFLTNGLQPLQNEIEQTFEAINGLGETGHLRGLSAKIHRSQYRTASAFLSLISNLKNNIPEKSDTQFTKKPPQNKKGGRRYRNQKYTKSYTPAKIQTAITLKKSMSFFANNEQQDAHEFFSFLLDAVHDECPRSIEKIFYGKCRRTTTCAHCGHESVVVEDFSSLPLPISMARKVLYSPYDLTKPMKRIQAIPDNLKDRVVLIGKTRKGNVIATKMSADFIEVIALEIPDLSDSNQNPATGEMITEENKYSNVDNIDGDDDIKDEEEESNNEDEDKFKILNEENNETDENKETTNDDGKDTDETNEETKNDDNKDNNETNSNKDANESNETNSNKDANESNETNSNKDANETNEAAESKESNCNDKDDQSASKTENADKNGQKEDDKANEPNPDTQAPQIKEDSKESNPDEEEKEQPDSDTTNSDAKYGVALLRVISKKSNEKTLPLLIKVPLNVPLSEEEIVEIVRERLRLILQEPDQPIKLVAPPKMFTKDKDKPQCRNPVACQVSTPIQPTRLETLFTKSEVPISVDELLDSFFSKMQLDEDNMWLCEKCKNNSCAYQQVQLLDTRDRTESLKHSENDQISGNQSLSEKEKESSDQKDESIANECEKESSNQIQESQAKEEATSEETQQQESQAKEEATSEETQQQESQAKEEAKSEETQQQESQAKEEAKSEESQQQESQTKDESNATQSPEKSDNTNDDNSTAPPPNSNDTNKSTFHLPQCLVLQLKRFLSKYGRLAKDLTTVVVPQYINVARYVEFYDGKEGEPENPTDENDKRYLYKLTAVSNHAGSLRGGHYTAYGQRKGSWYTFNDSVVSGNNSIFKLNDYFGSSNAYLLFYSKVEE